MGSGEAWEASELENTVVIESNFSGINASVIFAPEIKITN